MKASLHKGRKDKNSAEFQELPSSGKISNYNFIGEKTKIQVIA